MDFLDFEKTLSAELVHRIHRHSGWGPALGRSLYKRSLIVILRYRAVSGIS